MGRPPNLRRMILLGVLALSVAIPASAQHASGPLVVKPETEPPQQSGATAGAVRLEAPRGGNRLWSISLASLAATKERPVFSPSRRPPTVLPRATQLSSTTIKPPLALMGAIATEDGGIAIFLDSPTNKVIRLRTGDSHSGWTLKTVKAREATLQNEQRTVVVTLPNPPAK